MVAGLNYPAGAANPPVGGGVFTLTSAPDGAWTTPQHPRAVYYNGYTYFSWVNGQTTGPIYVASYNHATDAISTPVQIDGMAGPDTHNAPAIIVRDSDKKLLIAFCKHNGPSMFIRESVTSLDTDPTLGDGLTSAVNLDASIGGSDYTYPILIQLTGIANDPIYLFYRDMNGGTGRIAYSKSSDDGDTWSARTLVMTAGTDERPYFCIRGTTDRIDVMTTSRDAYGTDGSVNIGHMYLDGSDDSWNTSAGVEISASKPFTHSELTQLQTGLGAAFVMDGKAGTNPVFAYFIDNGDSTVTPRYARWDGAAWDIADIFASVDHFPVDRFFGGIAINQADVEEVFINKKGTGTTSELYSYVSADLGATWDAGTAITSGSGDLNASATSIEGGQAALPVIWLRGTITTSQNFSFGVRGLAR